MSASSTITIQRVGPGFGVRIASAFVRDDEVRSVYSTLDLALFAACHALALGEAEDPDAHVTFNGCWTRVNIFEPVPSRQLDWREYATCAVA